MARDKALETTFRYDELTHSIANLRNDLPELKALLEINIREIAILLQRVKAVQKNIDDSLLDTILLDFNKLAASLLDITERAFRGNYNDITDLLTIADDSLSKFYKSRKDWFNVIHPTIVDFELNQLNKDLHDNEILNNLKLSREEISKINDLYNTLSKKVEEFDERYSAQLAKLESLYQQDNFKGEAKKAKKTSLFWLIATIVIGGGLCFFAYIFLNGNIEGTHLAELSKQKKICEDCFQTLIYLETFKSVLYRLLIISILIFALGFCVRNYYSHMHNYTINLHKSNSLYASGILINRAQTSEGIDSLINAAANSIFTQQPTGYNYKGLGKIDLVTDQITRPIKPTE